MGTSDFAVSEDRAQQAATGPQKQRIILRQQEIINPNRGYQVVGLAS